MTVGDRVRERDPSGRVLREGDLQLLVAVDQLDRPLLGGDPGERVDHEDITVGVVVVEQHRQRGGAPRPCAEAVAYRDWRLLRLGVLGRRVLLALVDLLLVVLLLDELVPVVDDGVVLLHRPRHSGLRVVQHDARAVGPEGEGCARRHLWQRLRRPRRAVRA